MEGATNYRCANAERDRSSNYRVLGKERKKLLLVKHNMQSLAYFIPLFGLSSFFSTLKWKNLFLKR